MHDALFLQVYVPKCLLQSPLKGSSSQNRQCCYSATFAYDVSARCAEAGFGKYQVGLLVAAFRWQSIDEIVGIGPRTLAAADGDLRGSQHDKALC